MAASLSSSGSEQDTGADALALLSRIDDDVEENNDGQQQVNAPCKDVESHQDETIASLEHEQKARRRVLELERRRAEVLWKHMREQNMSIRGFYKMRDVRPNSLYPESTLSKSGVRNEQDAEQKEDVEDEQKVAAPKVKSRPRKMAARSRSLMQAALAKRWASRLAVKLHHRRQKLMQVVIKKNGNPLNPSQTAHVDRMVGCHCATDLGRAKLMLMC